MIPTLLVLFLFLPGGYFSWGTDLILTIYLGSLLGYVLVAIEMDASGGSFSFGFGNPSPRQSFSITRTSIHRAGGFGEYIFTSYYEDLSLGVDLNIFQCPDE